MTEWRLDRIKQLLDEQRCGEKHNTGFGCCRCTRNDDIDEILELLGQFIENLVKEIRDQYN